MLKREQPESIEAYSSALRERLAGVLPPEKIEEVVAETKCHLEERAEELRRRADVYEKQAVAEFIPAWKLASGINRAWAATYLRHGGTQWLQNLSAAVCVLALLLYMAEFLIVSKLPLLLQDPHYLVNYIAVVPVAVFLMALLASRPQLRRFIYGGMGAVVLFTILGGWLCSGKYGHISRFDAPAHYHNSLALQKFQQEEEKLLWKGIKFYQSNYRTGWTVAQYKEMNSTLFLKRERLKQYQKGRSVSLNIVQTLKEEITRLENTTGTYKKYQELDGPAQKHPEYLRVGKGYLVPRRDPVTKGSSVFRELDFTEQELTSAGSVGIYGRGEALVKAWQKTDLQGVRSLPEALIRWRGDAPRRLGEVQDAISSRRQLLQRDMALMASSKWRFEMDTAKRFGRFILYPVGILIAADALGGFLGTFLLRTIRRRRSRPGVTI